MEPVSTPAGQVIETSKRLARRLLTMGENRFELLIVEVQEERERLLRAILLALSVAALGLLAGGTLTGAIVVLFWQHSPLAALVVLTCLYGVTAGCLYRRLTRLLNDWQKLPATFDQLRKDCACLQKTLE